MAGRGGIKEGEEDPCAALKRKNAHPRDERIRFVEEGHLYYIDGVSDGWISGTTFVHSWFGSFNAKEIISKMKNGKNWGPQNKYYGMEDAEIMALWDKNRDEAATAGTKMHRNIELDLNAVSVDDDSVEFLYYKQFKADHPWLVPYRLEWEIFSEDVRISGSIDAVFQNKQTGKFVLIDWKRSKEIKMENRWQKAKPPIGHMDDTNFSQYSLQCNLYRTILNTKYDLHVDEMYLVVLHPDNPGQTYQKITVPKMDAELTAILNERKRQMIACA